MNCSIATDSQIANISGVLSKDVTGVSDNIVKVNGLSNAQCKYVQLNRGQIPKFDSKGITFGHHNIRTLIGKIDEFRHMCTNVFDVLCVNETHYVMKLLMIMS